MERQDRSTSLAGQQNGRGMPDHTSTTRRPTITNLSSTSLANTQAPPIPPVPLSSTRSAVPGSSLSASASLTPAQVSTLVRDEMKAALENEAQTAEVTVAEAGLNPGVTLDLSRKNIQRLPEEVVDTLKNGLERLALSHNRLEDLPVRFSECTSLRYLNIRGNQMSKFPLPLCELKSLEILDLGRNKLRILPPEIAKMSSLKVLSVPRNQIRELPHALAEMSSLQVLKFEGNPVSFSPKDAIQPPSASPPHDGIARDNEVADVAITAQIKKFLRQHALQGRLDSETTGDESSEAGDTPRFPIKRRISGRFPIRVNGTELSDARSPSSMRAPPPIPNRSHFRGLSQQSTGSRRPGVLPLTIGTLNERGRSNSETTMHSDRSDSRARRMGIVSRKTSDLGTLEETESNPRFSHFRGLSHGSAMQGTPLELTTPDTPSDPYQPYPLYVRRLSILPERRPDYKVADPVVEAAKGVLYSVFQIHPIIQMLMGLANDGYSDKRSSLEIVFYNTSSHVQELEREVQKHDAAPPEAGPQENEGVYRACQALIGAYSHVCSLLAENRHTFVDNGDPRYIRTLLMLLYHSVMELRVTCQGVVTEERHQRFDSRGSMSDGYTIRPQVREPSVTPTVDRPGIVRSRNGTLVHNPANLRVTTDVAVPHLSDNIRTATTITSATPRSGESFGSSIGRTVHTEFTEEDAEFEKIFLLLQKSADIVLSTLPNFNVQLGGGLRNATQNRAPAMHIASWRALINSCTNTVQQTNVLKNRLSQIKLKEPGLRSQSSFWNLCSNFMQSWTETAGQIRSAINKIQLPADTKMRLRPIQATMKETTYVILNSPWRHLFQSTGTAYDGRRLDALSPLLQTPITPQSAALGPAMQATVPITPQSASFAGAFQGNVFDRASALMANQATHRLGNMSRGHSNYNSLSSVSSVSSSDGNMGPQSTLSPLGTMVPAVRRKVI